MEDVIKSLKQIVRRYVTCMENNIDYTFKRDELEAIKKAIRYLDLVNSLSKEYRKDKVNDGLN